MKKRITGLSATLLLSGLLANAQLPAPINNPSWNSTPVLLEDFIGTSLNSTYWYITNNENHWGDPECYTNRTQNVSLSNGAAGQSSYLSLKLIKEAYICPSGCFDRSSTPAVPVSNMQLNYTSGMVSLKQNPTPTLGLLKYGYIEANISVPYDNTHTPALPLWPAFWTAVWGGTSPFSSMSEIDIMEQLAGYPTPDAGPQNDKMLGSSIFLHYADPLGCPQQTITWTKQGALPYSYANSFHKYACLWSPNEISWYFDDLLVTTYQNPAFIAETHTCPTAFDGMEYLWGGVQDPVKLILNVAYGGNMIPTGNELTLNAEMKVDYVKIFQQNADLGCSTVVSSINYDFTAPVYDNKVKSTITIGGTGANINTNGTITFPASPNISLQAAQSVELGAGFNTPNNSNIVIDVPGCPK